MIGLKRKRFQGKLRWMLGIASLALLAACGGAPAATAIPLPEGSPTPAPTSSPTATSPPATAAKEFQPATATPVPPTPAPTLAPTSQPTAETGVDLATIVADPLPDDPTALMLATLDGRLDEAAQKMAASGNKAFIPVLLEFLRFQQYPQSKLTMISFINQLLEGEDSPVVPPERTNWAWWIEWLGNHPEIQPPDGFAGWKGRLYSFIDGNFKAFFFDGVDTRIRLEEVVWGGVKKDGIPDLITPPVVAAADAAYLEPSDRVFGVSFNGESRAYPLRILNPHEMANDVVGGVHFALAY